MPIKPFFPISQQFLQQTAKRIYWKSLFKHYSKISHLKNYSGTQLNVLLLDVLITLSLEKKLGLSLQIFDLHLQIDLHDSLPQSF